MIREHESQWHGLKNSLQSGSGMQSRNLTSLEMIMSHKCVSISMLHGPCTHVMQQVEDPVQSTTSVYRFAYFCNESTCARRGHDTQACGYIHASDCSVHRCHHIPYLRVKCLSGLGWVIHAHSCLCPWICTCIFNLAHAYSKQSRYTGRNR